MKILIATQKPFAAVAVEGIKEIARKAGYECAVLEKYTESSQLVEAVKEASALIIRSDKITSQIMDAAPHLKIVIRAGAGYDNVDLKAATERNICVMNTPGQNANAVAELVLGLMVYRARGFFNGKPGTELKGKKLGIHAFGNVGKNVAHIARGFGMKVSAFDPFLSVEDIEKNEVTAIQDVNELYQKNQYISLHIPANKHTIKSIDYALLKQMPENAVLVNTARKEVIDEAGLQQLMEERPDFSYIADFKPEMNDVALEKFAGRIYYPSKKMGAQTAEANINAGLAAARQIVDYLKNGIEKFRVNN